MTGRLTDDVAGPAPAAAPDGSVAARFDPHPACSSSARGFVVDSCREWQLDRYADDAALCTGELVSNAILHARAPFTIALRRLPEGLRLDVHDDRPDLWPVLAPAQPLEDELMTTGRGLAIVGALASRWGYFNTPVAKTMWAEFLDGVPPTGEPTVELANSAPDPDALPIVVAGLPTRVAIASGMHIDDLIREVQLWPDRLVEPDGALFDQLLDRTARLRLTGRQKAFNAAAAGQPTLTLRLDASPSEVAAFAELEALLARLAAERGLHAAEPSAEVVAMRQWLVGEITAQHRGAAPTSYQADSTGPAAQARSRPADSR